MRKIIVNIATSGGLSLEPMAVSIGVTKRPAPDGFHGVPKLSRSIDAKILGRKTSVRRTTDRCTMVFRRRLSRRANAGH
jgi:hypothetical protein